MITFTIYAIIVIIVWFPMYDRLVAWEPVKDQTEELLVRGLSLFLALVWPFVLVGWCVRWTSKLVWESSKLVTMTARNFKRREEKDEDQEAAGGDLRP